MRLSRRQPPEDTPNGSAAAPDGPAAVPPGPPARAAGSDHQPAPPAAAGSAGLAAALVVEDELEPRIRIPSDLLRCMTAGLEIALLIGVGFLGRATASGFESDVVGASEHIARGLVSPLHKLAFIALIALPVGLAIQLVIMGQLRRLAEAIGVGLVASGVTVACNVILALPELSDIYRAVVWSQVAGVSVFDPYLAGLAAYLAVIGLAGRQHWRTWLWLAIVFYCVTSLALYSKSTTVLSLLIALLLGVAIGAGLRYLIGTSSDRPTAAEIAAALSQAAEALAEIRRVPDATTDNRRYAAVTTRGRQLDVLVFDRDQQAANAIYRIYRRLRLTSQASRNTAVTVSRAVERQMLMTYAVQHTGVATPGLVAAVRVGPDAAAIARHHCAGTTLAELPQPPSEALLGEIFDTVCQLHHHRVTHRSLTPDHIQLPGKDNDRVRLLEPSDGDVAASDLQIRLDLAQLTAAMALLVGPDAAADLARRKLGTATVSGLVPLMQPVVLHRSTRAALRRRKDVLPALRKALVGGDQEAIPPVQLERIRPRAVITLVAAVVAAYIVIGQFNRRNLVPVLRQADWRWVMVALGLSAVTYVGATFSLNGFVLEKLSFARTMLAQLAGSFVTLVTPAAVGGVALNIRYLHKAKVAPADAASSVGVSQVFAFALHLTLLVVFVAVSGTSHSTSFKPPGWAYIALAALGAVVLAVLAMPAGRRLVRSRVAPALGQVIPRLLDITQKPAKLAEGVGGALLLTLAYILGLDVSVLAVGGHAAIAQVAVVYLTGSAIGSIVPTPGGLGAVEAALSAGLSAVARVPGAYALSAVLLFRLVTFWLPIPLGWLAMNYLQRHDAL